jgi:hypothetical protein
VRSLLRLKETAGWCRMRTLVLLSVRYSITPPP